MSLAARLGRMSPVLTARERAALTIRSELNDQEPDPALRRNMPGDQLTEFNRLIALYYIANSELATIAYCLKLQADLLEADLEIVVQLKDAADSLAEQLSEPPPEGTLGALRKRSELPVPLYLLGQSLILADRLARTARYRYQELLAIETVWQEIRDQLDGEEIVRSDRLELAAETKQQLLTLIGDSKRGKALQPTMEQLEQYRGRVAEVLHAFHLLEAP
jgi:hypothetical protein